MKKINIIIVSLILVGLVVGFFIFGKGNTTGNTINNGIKEITIKASRFQYSPEVITLNKGDKVKINVENLDTLHGIRIPEFNVKGETGVEFIADKSGEFDFYCTVYCGDKHKEMKGKLIVK